MGLFNRSKQEEPKAAAKPVAEKKVAAKVAEPTVVAPLLLQPVITEKATLTGTYIFKVSKHATKNEVSKAFAAKYGKKPRKVNVLNVMGKTKMRGRVAGKRSDWKKAVVYLTKGETVDLYQ